MSQLQDGYALGCDAGENSAGGLHLAGVLLSNVRGPSGTSAAGRLCEPRGFGLSELHIASHRSVQKSCNDSDKADAQRESPAYRPARS